MILKSGSANFQWIHDELIVKESFRRRILELNNIGYIEIDGNNIKLTKNGHKISWVLVKVQKIFSIINSG
jgi:superfamily II helicase